MANRLILICFIILSSGCVTLPQDIERIPSYSIPSSNETQIGIFASQLLVDDSAHSAVVLLDTGQEAFVSRIALANKAERSLDAQYYIWNADHTGRLLAERLLAAAERGVRVRLLLDDLGVGNKDHALLALNSHLQIEVRVYNPFNPGFRSGLRRMGDLVIGFGRLNRRMHSKTYIADGSMAIVGGRNIGDEYFDANQEMNYRDRELLVSGPVVTEISQQFDVMWNSQWAIPIHALVSFKPSPEEAQQRYQQVRELIHAADDRIYRLPETDVEHRRLFNAWKDEAILAPVDFIYNPPAITAGDEFKGSVVADHLMRLLSDVEDEILVESAYFILSEEFLQRVQPLLDNNIKIRALTNSLVTTDVWPIHAGYSRHRDSMLKRGIELYEFRPDATSCSRLIDNTHLDCSDFKFSLHAKSAVFDRSFVYVGSFNFNLRSRYLNTEIALLVHSEELAERIAQDIEENMQPENSWQVMLNDAEALEWHSRTAGQDHIETHEPQTGSWLRFKTYLFSLFPMEKYL